MSVVGRKPATSCDDRRKFVDGRRRFFTVKNLRRPSPVQYTAENWTELNDPVELSFPLCIGLNATLWGPFIATQLNSTRLTCFALIGCTLQLGQLHCRSSATSWVASVRVSIATQLNSTSSWVAINGPLRYNLFSGASWVYYYYYYYYKCHGLQCCHHTVAGHFTKSRYKTVAQLNADVCWPSD